MYYKKLLSIIEITRPVNVIFTFAVVVVAAIISLGVFSLNSIIILAGVSASFVIAAGNIINDIFDIDIDKINRPNRVLPSNKMSIAEAKMVYAIFTFLAILLSSQISLSAIFIVIITSVILFFYSKIFKRVPLIGNIAVAVCTGLAFLYGGIVVENIEVAVIPAIFAFLINIIREILKDIEDIEGDRKNDYSTLPIVYGAVNSKKVISLLIFILIVFTFYPFLFHLYKIEYFIIVLFFVDLPLVFVSKELLKKDSMNKLSKLSLYLKVIMVFGLISIFVGII